MPKRKKSRCMDVNIKLNTKGVPPKRRILIKKKNKNYEELNLDSQLTKISSKKYSDFPISPDDMINLIESNNSN